MLTSASKYSYFEETQMDLESLPKYFIKNYKLCKCQMYRFLGHIYMAI